MTFIPVVEGDAATPAFMNARFAELQGVEAFNVVASYGAMGDGVTNDASAIQDAITDAVTAGGGVIYFPKGTYNLGNRSAAEAIFSLNTPQGIHFVGDRALLVLNTADDSQPQIFNLTNPSNVSFSGLRFQDTGLDLSINWHGCRCIVLTGSGSSGTYSNISVRDCVADDVVTFFECSGAVNARINNIHLDNCIVRDSYYGLSFQNQGDGVRATGIRCENVRRAYFPYGVVDHDVDVSVYHNGTALGSNGVVPILSHTRNTSNIRVRLSVFGDVSQYGTAVALEHQPSVTGAGRIQDVEIDLHIDPNVTSPNTMTPIRFSSYTAALVEETSTTDNLWDRIFLKGDFGSFSDSTPINFRVRQNAEGRLYLAPSIYASSNKNLPHYPGFVVRTAHDREFRTATGNLGTTTISLPFSQLDSLAFAARITTYAQDDYTSLGVQNATVQENVLLGYNAGGGTTAIQSNTTVFQAIQGSNATIVFTASGENINVTFGGAPYNTSNGYARVETHFLGKGPQYT